MCIFFPSFPSGQSLPSGTVRTRSWRCPGAGNWRPVGRPHQPGSSWSGHLFLGQLWPGRPAQARLICHTVVADRPERPLNHVLLVGNENYLVVNMQIWITHVFLMSRKSAVAPLQKFKISSHLDDALCIFIVWSPLLYGQVHNGSSRPHHESTRGAEGPRLEDIQRQIRLWRRHLCLHHSPHVWQQAELNENHENRSSALIPRPHSCGSPSSLVLFLKCFIVDFVLHWGIQGVSVQIVFTLIFINKDDFFFYSIVFFFLEERNCSISKKPWWILS